MLAFADGDYARTIELGLPVRDRAHTFGGSHAQRDVITLTLIEAALRSNRAQPGAASRLRADDPEAAECMGIGGCWRARIECARRYATVWNTR